MARCSCGILPLITIDPDSALTMTGTGTAGDPLVLGNRPAPMGQVVFATPGVAAWNKASVPGVQWIKVRVVGGGGGSAGATAGAGVGVARGGGAGGNYAESWLDVDPLAASVTVTVGAGGTAGAAANGDGGAGGASSFGALVVAGGGGGSLGAVAVGAGVVVANGGVPGGGNVGDLGMLGQIGGAGIQLNANERIRGTGGAAGLMGVGTPIQGDLGSGNNLGQRYGGGAGGPAVFNGVNAGSAGGGGLVVVEMFR